jgi:lipoprotein-releasing system permease protein
MNHKLLLNIAKSLLMARWRQSLVAAVGVTFGIAMFVTLLGFMTGLNKLLDGLILNRTPHVRLFNDIKPNIRQPINESKLFNGYHNFISSVKSNSAKIEIYNIGAIMQSLKKDERVLGISPRNTAQVFFNNGTIDINGLVNGIDVEQESRLFYFTDYVIEGKATDLKNVANSIILGKGLAKRMQAEKGDVIQISTSLGDRYALKVIGIYQSGISEFDKAQCYASITTTQKILGKANNYITDIQIKLKDLNEAPAIAKEYAQLYSIDTEDFQTANSQFETGSTVRTIISYSVGIVLLIVAGFGIYNILNMMIYEKMDSIAILKATGFSGIDVKRIFLAISFFIGFFGGVLGLLFGLLLSFLIDQIPFNTASLPTVTTYPINYSPVFYLIGISFSLITTYLAGFFPARKASKVDPVVIIRGK